MAKRKAASPSTDYDALAGTVRVLADPARLRILNMLSAGALGVTEIVARLGNLAQPTVSHHLRVLYVAGFVGREKTGVTVQYSYEPSKIDEVVGALRATGGVNAT